MHHDGVIDEGVRYAAHGVNAVAQTAIRDGDLRGGFGAVAAAWTTELVGDALHDERASEPALWRRNLAIGLGTTVGSMLGADPTTALSIATHATLNSFGQHDDDDDDSSVDEEAEDLTRARELMYHHYDVRDGETINPNILFLTALNHADESNPVARRWYAGVDIETSCVTLLDTREGRLGLGAAGLAGPVGYYGSAAAEIGCQIYLGRKEDAALTALGLANAGARTVINLKRIGEALPAPARPAPERMTGESIVKIFDAAASDRARVGYSASLREGHFTSGYQTIAPKRYSAAIEGKRAYAFRVDKSGEIVEIKPKGSQNPSTAAALKRGQEAHRVFTERVALLKEKGWEASPRIVDDFGKIHIPDARTPGGYLIELKPRTKTGIKQGQKQIQRYLKAAPTAKKGRVIYYDVE